MHKLKSNFFIAFLVIFLLSSGLFSQDSTLVNLDSGIKVTADVSQKEVPLNRLLTYTVKVEWSGDLSHYQVSELENPILENFEILSTSTADRRVSEGGVNKALKIYEFVLKPKSLGMGYIEGVVVKYIDNKTGEGHHLMTNRLDVRVIESVPEPGSRALLVKWIVAVAVLLAIFILLGMWGYRKKKEKQRKEAENVEVVPLEEEFLTMLHGQVKLKSPDLNVSDTYWTLSKIFRRYLSQKYEIAALEYTTDEIISALDHVDLSDTDINNIKEIFHVCDLAKFAGSAGDRNELERIYTLIESILEKNLAQTKIKEQQEENQAKK